jgi:hypothetical protein
MVHGRSGFDIRALRSGKCGRVARDGRRECGHGWVDDDMSYCLWVGEECRCVKEQYTFLVRVARDVLG